MYTYLYLCTYFYLTTGESWGPASRLMRIVHIIMYTYVHLCTRMYKHVFLQQARGPSACLIHIMYVYTYVHLCTPMHTYVHICIHITSESGGPAPYLCGPRCSVSVDACTLGYVHWCTLSCVLSCTFRYVHLSIVYMYTYVRTSLHDITSTYILYTCTPTYTYVHLCRPTYAYLCII